MLVLLDAGVELAILQTEACELKQSKYFGSAPIAPEFLAIQRTRHEEHH